MRQFVVLLSEKQKHLMTEQLIRGHVAYLSKLSKEGSLRFCGPCTDGSALMILQCSSPEEAQKLVEADPFSHVAYYASRKIVEIEEANEANEFHLQQVLQALKSRSMHPSNSNALGS
jgi:uncharacterized protein YciI